MMLPQDALLLAATKLKTRRVRLIVTVVVAGLLFIILSTVSLVMNGAISSVESFSEEGLGKRYIVQLGSVSQSDFKLQSDPQVVAEVRAKFEALKKEKTAAAKRIGATYDPLSEQSPIIPNGGPNGEEYVDIGSKIAMEVIAGKSKESSLAYYSSVTKAQEGFNTVGQYASVSLGGAFGPSTSSTTISTIKNGKETDYSQTNGDPYATRGIEGVKNGLTALSDEVLAAFTLQNQTFELNDGIVPVVAPYSAAEEILGLNALPTGTKTDEKLDRLKTVRQQISGKTFQVCLRNSTSLERQQLADQQTKDFAANKDKKDYRKPDLMFAKSETPCADVVISRDVRTADQKKLEAKQEEFDQLFGKQVPTQRVVTMKVVGIAADPPSFASFQITDILGSLLTSSVGSGWFVPLSAASALPEYSSDFAKVGTSTDYNVASYVEFSSAQEARRFTKEKNCSPNISFAGPTTDPFADCVANGTPFFINSFGSSSVALEDLRSGFSAVFSRAMFVIALISALIMMGTVGKIISDSRRETAVFRAIGAKRFDIAQIYLTYTLLIALIISLFTISVGWLLASFVDNRYGSDFTVQSLVSFNASNLDKRFSLIGFDMQQLSFLVLVIIIGSLLAAAVPLLSNLRRNPIKDMRDER